MTFIRTTAINKLRELTKRIKGVPGGTSAGKTYGILPVLIDQCAKTPGIEVSVVSESVPHLKRGAIKDFKSIMEDTGRFFEDRWNATDSKYTFANKAYIEFFSADNPGKVHGPRRDVLYINEANRIAWDTYHALAIRTKQSIWLDFNPTKKFWYHTEVKGDPDWEEVVLTYKDNEALSDGVKRELEKAKEKAKTSEYWSNWWRVYGLGQVGMLEGQIFQNWLHVPKLPHKKRYIYGLDFGYTNDPTALVKVCRHEGQIYAQEMWYRSEYSSKEMIEYLYSIGVGPADPIICDHDKTAVQDLRDHGFRAFFADKKKGSVLSGIQAIQDEVVNITQDSLNWIQEEENYMWDVKDGKNLNDPIDAFNHCFEGNTMITTDRGLMKIRHVQPGTHVLTSKGYRKVLKRWDNGVKEVTLYQLQFKNFSKQIKCTHTHLFKTQRGWIPISQLVPTDIVYLHRSSMEKSTGSTKVSATSPVVQENYTGMYGSISRVPERMGMISTTSMRTPITTELKTFRRYLHPNISVTTARSDLRKIQKHSRLSIERGLKPQRSGMLQRKVRSGMQNMPGIPALENQTTEWLSVDTVRPSLTRRQPLQSFVATSVNQHGDANRESITRKENVFPARLHSSPASTARPRHAVGHVLTGICGLRKERLRVYDLHVEDQHEYFANGILVHNCHDAFRYTVDYLKNPIKYRKQDKERRAYNGRRKVVYAGK